MAAGRARAPTINIDTSAVGAPEGDNAIALEQMSNPTSPQESRSIDGLNSSSPGNFLAVPSAASLGGDTFAASSDGRSIPGDSTMDIVNDQDALKPDPGTEADFQVDNNPFAFSAGQLGKLYNPKSLAAFHAMGGVMGLEKGLRTNIQSGLNSQDEALEGHVSFDDAVAAATDPKPGKTDQPQPLGAESAATGRASKKDGSFAERKRVFKDNRLPERKSKNIFQLMWITYNDKVLILLSIAAVISLAIGIYQSVQEAQTPGGEAPIEWVEGVAIMVAIIIVVVVGSLNDWQKERQFVKLNKKKDNRFIKIVRSGRTEEISVYDLLVGDIVLLEPGDIIPVDGIYISGHNLKCDESSATGESDLLKKTPAAEAYAAIQAGENVKKMDPFILSGSKVNEGVGRFIATATGVNSTFGRTMMSLRDEGEVTPLQAKLGVLATYIAKLGSAAALLYFVVAFIEFLVRITRGSEASLPPDMKGQKFLEVFIIAVTIIVVAVPEGLPLAVTLALAFATTRMLKDNNLVRLLRSCETMGNATTVCSDKTGTLTQNVMSVVAGTLGTTSRFGDHKGLSSQEDDGPAKHHQQRDNTDVSPQETIGTLAAEVKTLMLQSFAINSTAFEGEEDGKHTFIGSKTETALLGFAKTYLGMGPVAVERSNVEIVHLVPFDSSRKSMATIIKKPKGGYRMFVKGASEILLSRCTSIIEDPTRGASSRTMTSESFEALGHIISAYASRSLRTIGVVYRDFESWPPKNVRRQDDDPSQLNFDDLLKDLTFVSVVGIQDPLRHGVAEAVAQCVRAGVFVRMVTGDNVQTAKAIATQCGIFTGGEIMEGPDFRKLSRQEMDKVIPRLQVLARSSPEDKRILVKRLKELGETVAVTGDGTNDAPALKMADVGFSMGITGTEVAKEASAIILMDDNFASIVKALMWGRAVNDAVKKFLQFQITVNITAVFITFITGVASSDGNSAMTAVQLLWINLIMDTFAALALATDPPADSCLDRKPEKKSAPLITVTMWKMIIGQAIYQLVVVMVLYFRGCDILDYTGSECDLKNKQNDLTTVIFNAFVWMQIFNALNNRRLDNRFNVFEGITRNYFFIGIIAIMVGFQIMIIFVGGAALSVVSPPIDGIQWAISLVLGALTIPIGIIIRLVPDEFVRLLVPGFIKRRAHRSKTSGSDEEQKFEWNPTIEEVRDQLQWLKKMKGGRLNTLKFKIQHPREAGILPPRPSTQRSRSSTTGSIHQLPKNGDQQGEASPRHSRSRSSSKLAPAMISAGVVAGSIAGWSPSPLDKHDRNDKPPTS